MNRLASVIFIILIILAVKHDLTFGTLPDSEIVEETKEVVSTQAEENYFLYEVGPGETLISIMENKLDGPITVPISMLSNDFMKLNNNLDPRKLKIGKTYKFPKLEKEENTIANQE